MTAALQAHVLSAIEDEADRAFAANPGQPLSAETAEPVRRLLPEPQGRENAA